MRALIVGLLLGVAIGGCLVHVGRRWLAERDARAREAGTRAALSEVSVKLLLDELSRRDLHPPS